MERVVDRLDERQLSHRGSSRRRVDVDVREEQLGIGRRLGLGGGDPGAHRSSASARIGVGVLVGRTPAAEDAS